MNTEEKTLKKDRECAECRHLFDCEGKPVYVKQCLFFERVKNYGNQTNC